MPVPQTLNIENLNRLIAVIEADDGTHFAMQNFITPKDDLRPQAGKVHYRHCNTALCFAGHINLMRMQDEGLLVEGLGSDAFSSTVKAGEWLGWDTSVYAGYVQAQLLFMPYEERLAKIDSFPPAIRREMALYVLRKLRDEDEIDWFGAIALGDRMQQEGR